MSPLTHWINIRLQSASSVPCECDRVEVRQFGKKLSDQSVATAVLSSRAASRALLVPLFQAASWAGDCSLRLFVVRL